MENTKKIYILSIILLLALLFFAYSEILSKTSEEALSIESRQHLVQTDDSIFARFSVFNNGETDKNSTFVLYFNDEVALNDTVLIRANDRFEFGGHFPTNETGKVKVTAALYDTDKKKLTDTSTYYVTVNPG